MTERVVVVTDVDNDVEVSHIRWRSPSPARIPDQPEGIDYLNYLRYRQVSGPTDPAQADAVIVVQPGTWAGAYSLDRIGRNVVRAASERGLTVEWWAIARRSDGATDLTGIKAGRAAKDPALAFDYYFRGAEVDGRIFEGFRRGSQLRFLAELGFAQVIKDQHELLERELPDPVVRKAKVFCAGHSLGSLLASGYAAWDFDGTPGHELCAGVIAIDSLASVDPLRLADKRWAKTAAKLAERVHRGLLSGLRSGRMPNTTAGMQVTKPEAFVLAHVLGLAAAVDGNEETQLHRHFPTTRGWETVSRIIATTNYRGLLKRSSSVRSLRLTGEALFGLALSDHGIPIDPLQVSIGSLDGPVTPRPSFPVPRPARRFSGVRAIVGAVTEVPADSTRLYGWKPGGNADIQDVARVMSDAPLSTFEMYFPMRIHFDLWLALLGSRFGEMAALAHAGEIGSKPTLHVMGDPDRFVAWAVKTFRLTPPQWTLTPGYGHIDMAVGAARPGEPVAATIADFLAQHVMSAPAAPVEDVAPEPPPTLVAPIEDVAPEPSQTPAALVEEFAPKKAPAKKAPAKKAAAKKPPAKKAAAEKAAAEKTTAKKTVAEKAAAAKTAAEKTVAEETAAEKTAAAKTAAKKTAATKATAATKTAAKKAIAGKAGSKPSTSGDQAAESA